MTSILLLIGTIEWNQFRSKYLKHTRKKSYFFSIFFNLDQILNILKKKMTFKADVFPNLRTAKDVLR